MKRILITGGAGFIGSEFVRQALDNGFEVAVVDALTYAGNLASIEGLPIRFYRADIGDAEAIKNILADFRPEVVVNFAAESHVDRSVDNPRPFVVTNVLGTQNLLECCRCVDYSLEKFIQVSTDEVYGDLDIDFPEGVRGDCEIKEVLGYSPIFYGKESFSEESPIKPSSPYSASKAAADHLALAYAHTFGLPVVVTRCSNNYGPRQFPEKLIPLMINNIFEGRQLPVYGQGLNVRDWIHVSDHCRGIFAAIYRGIPGKVYNFGGYNERRNIDIVKQILSTARSIIASTPELENLASNAQDTAITFVKDRPGHDRRYAINARRAIDELGWKPLISFADGLRDTITWYFDNRLWVEGVLSGEYKNYYTRMYTNR